MSRRRESNVLDRRATKLAGEVDRRADALFKRLVDPTPAFMVRKSEVDALGDYVKLKTAGTLGQLRESFGGPYADEWVDAYVAWGERMLVKHYPQIAMTTGLVPVPETLPEWTGNLDEPAQPPTWDEQTPEMLLQGLGGPAPQPMAPQEP